MRSRRRARVGKARRRAAERSLSVILCDGALLGAATKKAGGGLPNRCIPDRREPGRCELGRSQSEPCNSHRRGLGRHHWLRRDRTPSRLRGAVIARARKPSAPDFGPIRAKWTAAAPRAGPEARRKAPVPVFLVSQVPRRRPWQPLDLPAATRHARTRPAPLQGSAAPLPAPTISRSFPLPVHRSRLHRYLAGFAHSLTAQAREPMCPSRPLP